MESPPSQQGVTADISCQQQMQRIFPLLFHSSLQKTGQDQQGDLSSHTAGHGPSWCFMGAGRKHVKNYEQRYLSFLFIQTGLCDILYSTADEV